MLNEKNIQWEAENQNAKTPVPQDKKLQLEAVKRWYEHDWRRIEPKLRTSIVEGISVFLSLFDDNPGVKRTFCPPPEQMAHRKRKGLRTQLSGSDECGAGESPRCNDEA